MVGAKGQERGNCGVVHAAENSRPSAAGEFARFASRRIAAKSRGDSESLSMRPLALLPVVPECSCRESGGFSFRVHKFSRSKDLKTLDPRQHRSGKTEILDQSLNSPPDGSPGKFSAMRSEQILQRTWFSVREFSAAKGCNSPGLSFRF